MKENEYQCASCKGVFEKGWADDEAKQEATDVFGKSPDEWNDEQMIVCDDCYKTMVIDPRSPAAIERAKQII